MTQDKAPAVTAFLMELCDQAPGPGHCMALSTASLGGLSTGGGSLPQQAGFSVSEAHLL